MSDINLVYEDFLPLHLFVRSPRCKSHLEDNKNNKDVCHDDKRKYGGSEIIVHERATSSANFSKGSENLEEKLRMIADEAILKFSLDDILCWARLGVITAGNPYLRLIVWSKHRAQGIEATEWILKEIQNSNVILSNSLGEKL